MAIIHQSRPTLEEKIQEELRKYYEKRFQEEKSLFYRLQDKERQSYASEKQAYKRSLPLKSLLLLGTIALIVLLAMNPSVIWFVKDNVHALFQGAEDGLTQIMNQPWLQVGEITTWYELIGLLLKGIVVLVILCIGIVVWLLKVSAGLIALLLCFFPPVALGVYAVMNIKNVPQKSYWCDVEFQEEEVSRQVQNAPVPDEIKILQSGAEGENEALQQMKKLNGYCHVYTNLMIPYDGKLSETDIIVVAPKSVTIVEVKNYRDELVGDWSDEHLMLEMQRGRKEYRREVYNPIKQVATHVYRLSGYLRENGVDVKVNRCVLFTHPDVNLNKMTDVNNILHQKCPVFRSGSDEYVLRDYLQKPYEGVDSNLVIPLLNKLVVK